MSEARRAVSVPWRAPLLDARGGSARGDDARGGASAGGTGAGGTSGAAGTSGALTSVRELTLLTVLGEDGVSGYGEEAGLPGYGGPGAVAAAALAARDLAAWDMRGRRARVPLWKLLGGATAPRVALNATIGAETPPAAAAEAAAAAAAGFRTVKLKVGVGDDAGRVRAVREAVGPELGLRLDANGAWSVPQAIAALRELARFGLECCEEPVHGLDGIAQVAAEVPEVPVAIDESGSDPGVFDQRICAALCLKVVRCGGITGILRDAELARAAGYEVYLASTLDGPLGIAAALHAAAVVRPDRACGLATLDRFAWPAPFAPVDGAMSPPEGPGLGDGLVDWYRTG